MEVSLIRELPELYRRAIEAQSDDEHEAKKPPELRVRIQGWVLYARKQKSLCFLEVRDGDKIQVVVRAKDGTDLHRAISREAALDLTGLLVRDERAPTGYEIRAEEVTVVGESKPLDVLNRDAGPHHRFNIRHLVLREERSMKMLKLRHHAVRLIRRFFEDHEGMYEVTPPTITGQEVEGGSTLFKFKYYDQEANLTQSSQLYLESLIPVLKRVYTILPSFRAEKSMTRRHLSEFTHCEAEFAFIDFDYLLDFLERMIKFIVNSFFESDELKALVSDLNPDLKPLEKPFVRMSYRDCLDYCNEHGITKEDGSKFDYGDDLTESPERKMVDQIGYPVMMTRFPRRMKAFYMEWCDDNPEETESVDVLLPSVGEVIGGSMRISDLGRLLEGFKRFGIKPDAYSWYTDQREFGTTPHGGFGLGIDRLILYLSRQESVKECVVYPRFRGRLLP